MAATGSTLGVGEAGELVDFDRTRFTRKMSVQALRVPKVQCQEAARLVERWVMPFKEWKACVCHH